MEMTWQAVKAIRHWRVVGDAGPESVYLREAQGQHRPVRLFDSEQAARNAAERMNRKGEK